MHSMIIIQCIGFVAAGLLIGSFQCKRSRLMFFFQMCSGIAYIIHFYLLGALSGSGSQLCTILRGFVYSQHGKKWADWKGWPVLIVFLNLAASLLTWKNAMSLLPFIGTAGTTIAGAKGNGKHVRLMNLFVCCPAWLIYDIYSHSIAGMMCETFILCSIIISVIRFGWKALDGDGEDRGENRDDEPKGIVNGSNQEE